MMATKYAEKARDAQHGTKQLPCQRCQCGGNDGHPVSQKQ